MTDRADRLCRTAERNCARADARLLREGLRLGVHELRPDLFGNDQRHNRRRPAGRSGRRALGAAAGHSRRRSRSGVRRCGKGRRRHRQADLQLPRRPALPVHRPVGKRARGVERALGRRLCPGMMSNSVGDAVDARAAGWVNRETSRPREGLRVKLQEARIASFRKPALGHDNVRFRASASELVPVDGTSSRVRTLG